jgi:hypothetical protein
MFDDLDNFPWHEYEHAYGTGEDIPDLIRALLSPRKPERQEAYSQLYMSVLHQGAIYTSTPQVASVLLRFLNDPTVPDRAEMMSFLSSALDDADVSSRHQTESRQWRIDHGELTPEANSAIEEELQLAVLTRAAVFHDVEVYFRALEDDDPAVRRAAIGLLSCNPEIQSRVQQRIHQLMLVEDNPKTLAAMILSMGEMRQSDPGSVALLEGVVTSREEPPVARIAAAFALARILNTDAKPEHFAKPIRMILARPERLWQLNSFYQNHLYHWMDHRFLHWLYGLRSASAELWIRALITLYGTTQMGHGYLREVFIHMTFGDQPLAPTTMSHQLTAMQREVLQALIARNDEWTNPENWRSEDDIFENLEDIGILIKPGSNSRADLIAFLEGKRPARTV